MTQALEETIELYGVKIPWPSEEMGLYFPRRFMPPAYGTLTRGILEEKARVQTKDKFVEGIKSIKEIAEMELGMRTWPAEYGEYIFGKSKEEITRTHEFADRVIKALGGE